MGFRGFTYLWLAGNEAMEKKVETTIMSYIETTIRIHILLAYSSGFRLGSYSDNIGVKEKKMETAIEGSGF